MEHSDEVFCRHLLPILLSNNWFQLHEISLLDRAISCSRNRPLLFAAIKDNGLFDAIYDGVGGDDCFVKWIRSRVVMLLSFRGRAQRLSDGCVEYLDNDIVPCFRRVKIMALGGCGKPALMKDDMVLFRILKCCHSLTDLDLSGSNNRLCIQDRVVSVVADTCIGLRKLSLSGCTKVSDEAVVYLLHKTTLSLEELSLSFCAKLSDLTAHAIAAHGQGLYALNICHCVSMTTEAVAKVLSHCSQLTSIDVSYLKNVVNDHVISALNTTAAVNGDTLTSIPTPVSHDDTSSSSRHSHLIQHRPLIKSSSSSSSSSCSSSSFNRYHRHGKSDFVYLDLSCSHAFAQPTLQSQQSMSSQSHSLTMENDVYVKCIMTKMYSLEYLGLTHVFALSDYYLSVILRVCTNLRTLKIASNPQLSQQSLCLIGQLTHIEHVDLFESRGVTDEVMVALAQCVQLKVLKIDACRRISDAGIEAISSGCHLLQTLSMNLMKDNLSDNAFVALVQGCKQLQRLEISGNKSITRATYSLLLEPGNCPDLQYVIAHGCNGLTPEDLKNLKTRSLSFPSPKLLYSNSPDYNRMPIEFG